MEVRVHLLGDSAELARRGQSVPEGMTSLEPLLAELIECGLNASACGKALGAVPQSTVGYEKRFNAALADATEERRFVKAILDGQPEPPSISRA
jgi:hypothetical protein